MSVGDFRSIFLYEFKLRQSTAKAARRVNQAFVVNSVSERTIQRWFTKFCSGDFSLHDEPRSGRFIVIPDEDLRTLVEANASQTVWGIAKQDESSLQILTVVKLTNICEITPAETGIGQQAWSDPMA